MQRLRPGPGTRQLRGVALMLVALGGAAPAAADPPTRVAPLVPQVTPPVSVEIGERFEVALGEGLGRARAVVVVPRAEVRAVLADPELSACNAAPCFSRIAAQLKAPRLVRCAVRVLGKAYAVSLFVYDQFGREVERIERRCEICTLAEVEDTIMRAAAELGPALAASAPPVAPPPAGPAPSPPASVPTSRPAPTPWADAQPPAAESQPAPVPPLRERLRSWNWRLIGIISAGVAVVGLAAGIPLAALANEPTCGRPDPKHSCPEIYTTTGGAAAFLSLGILAAGAAGTSFYLSWRFGRERGVTVAPHLGPQTAGLSARWQW